jgi:non-ribosomal peptide synthetase component F
LIEWNDTASEYPGERGIHELFEEQVAHAPEAIAVVAEEAQLTYQQLDQAAGKLASYLARLGVGSETVVAACLERSVDTIICLLGILKAGGAYRPCHLIGRPTKCN